MLPSWIRSRNCRPRLVTSGDRNHQPQVGFRHLALGAARLRLARRHLAVDFLQVLDWNADVFLQVDQPAQPVAQRLDLLGAKADVHQFVRDLVPRLQVGLAARAVLGQRTQHLVVEIADHRKTLERICLEAQQVGSLHRGLLFLAHLFFFDVFLVVRFLFLGKLPREFVGGRIDQAIDHLVDADFVAFDALREREDFGDRGRACGNRLDHVLQAVLDALRDFDFAFARQQLDRAHLPHIHAHRVGGAAEFRIDGGERRLSLLDHVQVGDRGRRVRHQQRLGIGRLVVHVDAHVVDHADDVLDLLGVEHVVGQVIVDLGIGQVAALLAEHDQVLEAHAARFGLERREFLALVRAPAPSRSALAVLGLIRQPLAPAVVLFAGAQRSSSRAFASFLSALSLAANCLGVSFLVVS